MSNKQTDATLTSVVRRKNISRYEGVVPRDGASSAERKIGEQLYSRAEIEALLANSNAINLWTKKCNNDVAKLSLDAEGVTHLVRDALRNGTRRSSEWCEQNPSGPWAACDVYVLRRKEWNSAAHREIEYETYLKFAISKAGTVLLMASCHPPEN